VPLLIGSTAQEIGGDEPAAKIASAIQKAYGGLADRALALYGLAGGGEGKPDPLYGGPGVQWPTDEVFRCPVIAEAVAHAAAGRLTYQYGFDHGAPDRPGNHGMGHSAELNYVFGTWGRGVQLAPIDRRISEQMQSYWTNFVRAGDPNGEGLPRWPSFAAKEREYIAFTDDGAVVKAGLRREFCEVFIEHLAGVRNDGARGGREASAGHGPPHFRSGTSAASIKLPSHRGRESSCLPRCRARCS
jgi:para-nitrobenzyl esterase